MSCILVLKGGSILHVGVFCLFCGVARFIARVAELVDALDLGSSRVTCEGSSPSFRTIHAVRSGAVDLAPVFWITGVGGFANTMIESFEVHRCRFQLRR
ncbi:hypothetical protein BN874_1620038 [Candidatus Contendobacter odensis Run_B_J11]|uniref:Uncharacterized protein n=1 Tax=Candidatus Contendobacter odensis Run_B_J11 TaxID=1400861 RepID=A0A7U7J3I4_9GAMM|nr:hypothetical protein BN874_1620038 [Candidatus Contendobacter odensis Run_B_J11]